MNRQNGENPEGKYIWDDEVANTDKTEPQYQLNPLTKKQDALMHRRRLGLLKDLVDEDAKEKSAPHGKTPGKA